MHNKISRVARGFTLIELLVVVTILGVITAWGVPTYTQYVLTSNRAEAITALNKMLAQQELFYANNQTYTKDVADLGYAKDADDFTTKTEKENYKITFAECGARALKSCVQLTAEAVTDKQKKDKFCRKFIANSIGELKSQEKDAAANVFNNPDNCWN